MTLETLRRLIDKHGAHCTLADAIIREGGERLRTRLGLPLDATEEEVHAAIRHKYNRIVRDQNADTQKGNPS